MSALSKSAIDRLGDRLRSGPAGESDRTLLDQYRTEFGPAYDHVFGTLKRSSNAIVTGRPAKSTVSIVRKLRRESIRLSQIQDVAGCRIVVRDLVEQQQLLPLIVKLFPGSVVFDRRRTPSHGYRAVHVVPVIDGYPIEIQVRSELQHGWAEFSELAADSIDPELKYGKGPEKFRILLLQLSERLESHELHHFGLYLRLQELLSNPNPEETHGQEMETIREQLAEFSQKTESIKAQMFRDIENIRLIPK